MTKREMESRIIELEAEIASLKERIAKKESPKQTKATKSSNKVIAFTDVSEYISQLNTVTAREEAHNIINGLKKSTLQAIAKHYSIPVGASYTVTQLKTVIVEGVIGAKLHHDVLLNTNLNSRPSFV